MADFAWTEQTEEMASLVADGVLMDSAIMTRLTLPRTTYYRWLKHPEFVARVGEITEAARQACTRWAIASKERRVSAAQDRWARMQQVIGERADAEEMATVAGGTSGLMVRTVKRVVVENDTEAGAGKKSSREIEEFAVDTGLLKELRELEKQVAQEMGQWIAEPIGAAASDGQQPPSVVEVHINSGPAIVTPTPTPSGS